MMRYYQELAWALLFTSQVFFSTCGQQPELYVFETDSLFSNEKAAGSLFLLDQEDSLRFFRPGSLFLSLDYEENTLKNINGDTYLLEQDTVKVVRDRKNHIVVVNVKNIDSTHTLSPVLLSPHLQEKAHAFSDDELIGKAFIHLRDSTTVYLGENHQYYVRAKGLFNRYNWYTWKVAGNPYLVLDAFQPHLTQVISKDSALAIYSPYYRKVIAEEVKASGKDRNQIDLAQSIRGHWKLSEGSGFENAADLNLIITDSTLITYYDAYPDYKQRTPYRTISEVHVIEFDRDSYLTVDMPNDTSLELRGNWKFFRWKWGEKGKELVFRKVK